MIRRKRMIIMMMVDGYGGGGGGGGGGRNTKGCELRVIKKYKERVHLPSDNNWKSYRGNEVSSATNIFLRNYSGNVKWRRETFASGNNLLSLSIQPTEQPTNQPTNQPSSQPSSQPANQPTNQPTKELTSQPTPTVECRWPKSAR
ncbi:hypothetical protein M0804_002338 [Polistes exclamans]|nr:hypothetical protein M0804_002338 [Polistes exclamans]